MNANDDSFKSTAEKIIKVYKFTEAFTPIKQNFASSNNYEIEPADLAQINKINRNLNPLKATGLIGFQQRLLNNRKISSMHE